MSAEPPRASPAGPVRPAKRKAAAPWIWRALKTIAVVLVAGGAGAWGYHQFQSYDEAAHGRTAAEFERLQGEVTKLQKELKVARAAPLISESQLQIERNTRDELARQIKTLQAENGQLKEDLALFEKLAAADRNAPGLSINGLHVSRDEVPGQYRYRFLAAVQGAPKDQKVQVSLQVIVAMRGAGEGQKTTMVLPAKTETDRQRFSLTLRHFLRVDQTFQVPEGAEATSVEIRLLRGGATVASQKVTL
jgi:hypothetical protein